MSLAQWGVLGFGAVIGWYLYFINRYRKADVQIGDLTTVIGAIGGAAVLKFFDDGGAKDFIGAYGIGIAVGFFGYFLSLVFLVGHSKSFNADWFLDGRRPNPPDGWGYGADAQGPVRPMAVQMPTPVGSGGIQNFYLGPQGAPGAGGAGGEKVELPIAGG